MERLFLLGAVACLVVSWIYIFLLKAKVRDCMTYIQYRIDTANRGLEGTQGSPEGGETQSEKAALGDSAGRKRPSLS